MPNLTNLRELLKERGRAEELSRNTGIFSVTDDDLQTRIYCKQLMQSADGSKYLHSVNKEIVDPDINYENAIDIHCIGRILI